MKMLKKPELSIVALAGLLAAALLMPASHAAAPSQSFTHFESFENTTENTAADPRDCNRNGIIDCGRDNDCTTVTPCGSCPSQTVCDEWTLPLTGDRNLRLAEEVVNSNTVNTKTPGSVYPSTRGSAGVVGAGSTEICPSDQDNGAPVSGVRADSMDFHIHTSATPDLDVDPLTGPITGQPGTISKAFRGQNSLHWGRHVEIIGDSRPGNRRGQTRTRVFGDTYCLQCINAFVLDREGDLNVSSRGSARLSFWHIAEYCDEECFAGFTGDTADEVGAVEARSAPTGTDAWGPWERMVPDVNPYDGQQDTAYYTVTYEPPGGLNPVDAPAGFDPTVTMCAPLTVYVAQGSAKGTDAACGDGDGNGSGDCGNVSSGTSTGQTGSGVWAQTSFDLGRYAGTRIQVRFITTTLNGLDVFNSYLETTGAPFNDPASSRDDGWYIDDIRVSGLTQ
jgi:hypothetical protein